MRDTAYPVTDPYWAYVIQEVGEDIVKIGVARRPEYRVAEMQCGNWRSLALVYQYETVGRELAHKIEFRTHRHLESFRIRGEWFRVSVIEAAAIIKGVAGSFGGQN
jgi:hypothetical protein